MSNRKKLLGKLQKIKGILYKRVWSFLLSALWSNRSSFYQPWNCTKLVLIWFFLFASISFCLIWSIVLFLCKPASP